MLQLELFLAGDNDVGGEGADRSTPRKRERFEQAFRTPVLSERGFLQFVLVRRLEKLALGFFAVRQLAVKKKNRT